MRSVWCYGFLEKIKMKRTALLSLFALAACASQATVLTFSGLHSDGGFPLPNYGIINDAYGDNVTTTNDGIGDYLMGTGWTPNVTTSYATVQADHTPVSNALLHWDIGYGDLVDVAFMTTTGHYGRLILTADAGFTVTLDSFDVAGYAYADLPMDALRVLDGSNNILWDSNATVAHGAGPTHDSYSPNVTGQTLVLEYGTNWNIGLDNVSFHQGDAVPEPATLTILGLGALALKRRRR